MMDEKGSARKVEIEINNRREELERVALVVKEFGQLHGIPSKPLFAIDLVLEEILSNIIKYAYADEHPHKIRVHLELMNNWVLLGVVDDGHSFDPLTVPKPNTNLPLADRPPGGLGLVLVRKFMDELNYARKGKFNHLIMKKRLSSEE